MWQRNCDDTWLLPHFANPQRFRRFSNQDGMGVEQLRDVAFQPGELCTSSVQFQIHGAEVVIATQGHTPRSSNSKLLSRSRGRHPTPVAESHDLTIHWVRPTLESSRQPRQCVCCPLTTPRQSPYPDPVSI